MNNKYSFISQSSIKVKKKAKTKKVVQKSTTSFTINYRNNIYISEKKESVRNEIDRIQTEMVKQNFIPLKTLIKLNSQTMAFLRSFYSYEVGDINNPKTIRGYKLKIDDSIEKNVLTVEENYGKRN